MCVCWRARGKDVEKMTCARILVFLDARAHTQGVLWSCAQTFLTSGEDGDWRRVVLCHRGFVLRGAVVCFGRARVSGTVLVCELFLPPERAVSPFAAISTSGSSLVGYFCARRLL